MKYLIGRFTVKEVSTFLEKSILLDLRHEEVLIQSNVYSRGDVPVRVLYPTPSFLKRLLSLALRTQKSLCN